MPRCRATTANGTPCDRIVGPSQSYCYAHAPENREARSRAASKAAKSKPNREFAELKAQLQDVADRSLSGDLEPRRATAATQALQAKIAALRLERDIREQEEFSERLDILERRAQGQQWGNRRYN